MAEESGDEIEYVDVARCRKDTGEDEKKETMELRKYQESMKERSRRGERRDCVVDGLSGSSNDVC